MAYFDDKDLKLDTVEDISNNAQVQETSQSDFNDKKSRKKPNKIVSVLLTLFIILLLLGAAFFFFSDQIRFFINQMYSNSEIEIYNNQVSTLTKDEIEKYLSDARAYNATLNQVSIPDAFSVKGMEGNDNYFNILNISGDGILGTVTVPSIDLNLPVYHGISDKYLDLGACHLASTPFPIGDKGNHSVISAHTAYPGKKFFDDLPKIKKGEYFYITVLNKQMVYKVVDINIVLPSDPSKLRPENDRDLVSLLTCYPYAVNTHRYIVTGERDLEEEARLAKENIKANDPESINWFNVIASGVGILLILIPLIILLILNKHADCSNCRNCHIQIINGEKVYFCKKRMIFVTDENIEKKKNKCRYMDYIDEDEHEENCKKFEIIIKYKKKNEK